MSTSTAVPATSHRMPVGAVIAVILAASFMDLVDVTIVAVAAPDIVDSLRATAGQLQWMTASYALALGATLITGGRLGDVHGRRPVFLTGVAGFVLASAACALAPSAGVLIAMRVVQGIFAGLMVPQVFGIIRSSLPPAQMGAALGAYGAVQGIASIAGPLLGGVLVSGDILGMGWRTIFWVNVPIGIAALLIGLRVLPDSREEHRSRLDLAGAGLLAVALLLLLAPIIQGRSWGWPAWGWTVMVAGLVPLAMFLVLERRMARRGGDPIMDPALLRDRALACGLAASFLFFGGIAIYFLALSLYLQDGQGRTALTTGLITLPYAVGSMVTSGAGVKLAQTHGKALLVSGSLVIAVSHALLWVLLAMVANPAWWVIGIPLLIGGLGLGLAAPPLVGTILAGVPPRHAGAAGGVLSTINQVGSAAGIAALGTVFFAHATDRLGDQAAPAQAFADALAATLPWQIGLYVLAAVLLSLLPAPRTQDQTH